MKVVFTAFNKKLWSKIEELPDNTSLEFRMPWPMDVMVKGPSSSEMATMSTTRKVGLFRHTGGSYQVRDLVRVAPEDETDESREWVKEYTLVDIY